MYAYWITVNYREAYNIFACNGILFNHESVPKNSPLIIKRLDSIDIIPIEDMFKSESHRYEGILREYEDAFVWNGEDWAKLLQEQLIKIKIKDWKLFRLESLVMKQQWAYLFWCKSYCNKNRGYTIGDKAFRVKFPKSYENLDSSLDLAKFIGFLVGDGSIDDRGRIRLIGSDKNLLEEMGQLLISQFGWSYRIILMVKVGFETIQKRYLGTWFYHGFTLGMVFKILFNSFTREGEVPQFFLTPHQGGFKTFFGGDNLDDGGNKGGWPLFF